MMPWTVPDFFQEETPEALRCQADWLAREVGLDDPFFASLVGADQAIITQWRAGAAELPPDAAATLRRFWQAMLHVLSFLNFDTGRVRNLFESTMPALPARGGSPLTPPWAGSTLKAYLEHAGADAIDRVENWVTGLRFGDPYAA